MAQFLDATDLVLSSASFKFDGRCYEQTYGSPMGSSLSPILADIIMDDLEIQCMKKLDFRMCSYYRFVDDIFLLIPRNKIDIVLKIFNEHHETQIYT